MQSTGREGGAKKFGAHAHCFKYAPTPSLRLYDIKKNFHQRWITQNMYLDIPFDFYPFAFFLTLNKIVHLNC